MRETTNRPSIIHDDEGATPETQISPSDLWHGLHNGQRKQVNDLIDALSRNDTRRAVTILRRIAPSDPKFELYDCVMHCRPVNTSIH